MKLNRREFLFLTIGLAAGCTSVGNQDTAAKQTINAGSASGFSIDGVYSDFRDQGFFIIRRGGQLFALSSICTHRKCKLTVEPDHSFYCCCHGSTFSRSGTVTQGPATRDLPMLPSHTNEQGQLIVKVTPA